jgi:outer membrane protein OmpA-like peptidoglycan-associated protein
MALALGILSFGSAALAQSQQPQQQNNSFYQVTLVAKTITSVSYQHRQGSTMIGFQGTPLLPLAKGDAKVDSKQGSIVISANFKNMQPAQIFGKEYLTYVLWAITPEGKPSNLGELVLDGNKSKLTATTNLQSFGMIVTAEPYFAVNVPSDVVVLENMVRPDTVGTSEQVTANYELLKRGQYTYDMSKAKDSFTSLSPKIPLEVYEARNAVAIAQAAGADTLAPDAFQKATTSLSNVDSMVANRNSNKKNIIAAARDTVQTAADARQIAVQRAEQNRLDAEKAAQQAATDAAQARQREEQAARQQAELQKLQAERDAAREAAARAQADAARAQADAAAQNSAQQAAAANAQAQAARDAAAKAEADKQALRAALLDQFNRILPTTDTPRGLQVNMADVLFAFGKYDLQAPAREALAKFSGIVLAHPGLHLAVEGYTDSVGTDAFNLTLSQQRADTVRAYLVGQGLDPNQITATGYGKSNPVSDNSTAAGRQQNRRVEIIISGEVIGTQIGQPPTATPQ